VGLDLEMSISKCMPQPNGYEDLKGLPYMLFAALHQFPMRNYLKYLRQTNWKVTAEQDFSLQSFLGVIAAPNL